MSNSPFNVILAEARIARNLSVKALADKVGCTTGFIRSYEDCAINPTAQTLFRYARALNLSVTITGHGITVEEHDTGALLLSEWKPGAD